MTDSAFNDDDPSVYKTHVLYYLNADPHCEKLIKLLETHPLNDDVYHQDINLLKQRPTWLDGVPVLVNKSTSDAHKGRNIYKYLEQWKSEEFLPANSSTGGYASFESPIGNLESDENGEAAIGNLDTTKFASLYDTGMFTMEDDNDVSQPTTTPVAGGSQRDKRRENAATEAQIKTQQLLEARNTHDQRV